LVELGRLPEQYLKPDSRETPDWLSFLPEEARRQLSWRQVPVNDIPPEFLRRALSEGRCLLLCDGLDEAADRSARQRLAQSLADFGRQQPGNRIVIASRPAGVSEAESVLSPPFQRCQIERLTPDEVKVFFRFWYSLDEQMRADERQAAADALFEQVKANPGTLSLAAKPLLATILLLIWRNEGTLPARRVELYERCCKLLIENWEAGHGIAYKGALVDLGWERHLRLLAPLAYAIHGKGERPSASKEELVPVLAQSLQQEGLCKHEPGATLEAEQFLAALGLRSGLLQYVGGGQYGFPHHTFQEYLAARHIGGQETPGYINLFMSHLHDAWWREVHLLTVGHLGSDQKGGEKASRLIQEILSVYPPPSRLLLPSRHALLRLFDPGCYLPRLQWQRRLAWMLSRELELVASALAEAEPTAIAQATQDLFDKRAGRLVREILRDGMRWGGIRDSVRVLSQTSPDVAQALLAALGDPDRDVRREAATSLGGLGQAIPEVVQARPSVPSDSYDVLVEGVWEVDQESLGWFGQASPEMAQALIAALGDNKIGVRRVAALSLGSLVPEDEVSPEVVQALLAALRDSDEFVRMVAASSMGWLDQASLDVVQALLAALRDSEPLVQQKAAEALGSLRTEDAEMLSRVLVALGRKMHDIDANQRVREEAFYSAQRLLWGRPLPGYRWKAIGKS
jgi:HEAT repeat protein